MKLIDQPLYYFFGLQVGGRQQTRDFLATIKEHGQYTSPQSGSAYHIQAMKYYQRR